MGRFRSHIRSVRHPWPRNVAMGDGVSFCYSERTIFTEHTRALYLAGCLVLGQLWCISVPALASSPRTRLRSCLSALPIDGDERPGMILVRVELALRTVFLEGEVGLVLGGCSPRAPSSAGVARARRARRL